MTKFNVGTWVEITPNSDYGWDEWTTSHDLFCGAIGQIHEVKENGLSKFEDNDKIRVVVDFKEEKFQQGYQRYWLWFLKRHVVLSNEKEADRKQELRKMGSTLQEWEATKKKVVNDSLKKVFGPPPSRRRPRKVDLWDEDTEEILLSDIEDNGNVIELPDDEELDDWFDQYGDGT